MNLWHFLTRGKPLQVFDGAKWIPWRSTNQAEHDLASCYRALFAGHAGEREAQVVLTDLANVTSFYRVNAIDVPSEMRAYTDGQRSVYAHIFRYLRMTEEETRHLEEAARQEAIAQSER